MSGPVGSVLPFPAAELGPPRDDSLWRLWTTGRDAASFRTARSALHALLVHRRIRRLWLPAFICDTLASACPPECALGFYAVDGALEIDVAGLDAQLSPGDAVLAVDYFGRPPNAAFAALADRRPDVLWVEDRAQAMADGLAQWGEVVLYSPRKLIGVADGGVLVGRNLPRPDLRQPGADDGAEQWRPQIERLEDPEGAAAARWYGAFQDREAAFAVDGRPMSRLTRALLDRIAYPPLALARRANWRRLAGGLADYALWPQVEPVFTPMAFPIRVADPAAAVRDLAAQGLFCARHWADLPSPQAFQAAHRLSGHILSLPCDHRYGDADMARLIEAVGDLAPIGGKEAGRPPP